MAWLGTLITEGWPLLLALALVAGITYGALRPYMKPDAARRRKLEHTDD
ncbi:MAG: hypothetical protein AAGA05_04070 [Pseudomonadota bacterium]